MSTTYSNTRTKLEARLRDQRDFRDSQPDGSSEHEHFQKQATATAQSLILLDRNEDQLCALDNELAQRASALAKAERRQRERVAPWKRGAIGGGVASAAMVVAGWSLSLMVLTVLGLLVGVGAGAAVYFWMEADSKSRDEVRRQAARWQQARDERRDFARQVLPNE